MLLHCAGGWSEKERFFFFKAQKGSRKDGVEVCQAGSLLGLATAQYVSSFVCSRGDDKVQLCDSFNK